MAEIYQYSVAILIGVAIFGAILGVLRLRHNRQMRSAEGLIRKLEGTAVPDLEGEDSSEKILQDEEILPARPSLYGIPYLAGIITSLVIPSVFLILSLSGFIKANRGKRVYTPRNTLAISL